MELTIVVCLVALVEYLFITSRVGSARIKYEVPAPATTGHDEFERLFRIQQNTLEQLVVFIPAALAFGYLISDPAAAIVGTIFVLGRALYFLGYSKAPEKRAVGMLLTFLSNIALVLGALFGAIRDLLQ